MADLPEVSNWDPGVYQLETNDLVLGGVNGPDNKSARNLANRTLFLKNWIYSHLGSGLPKQSLVTCRTYQLGPDFITAGYPFVAGTDITISGTSSPLVVCFSGGYNAQGPLIYYGYLDTNVNVTITGSGQDMLLVAVYDPATHVMSFAFRDYYAPVYSFIAPASPVDGWYWYDLTTEKMFRRVSGAWVNVIEVVLGYVSPADEIFVYDTQGFGKSAMSLYGRSDVPVGTIIPLSGVTLPPGYLKCNGAAVSRTVYGALFARFGIAYGPGNGTTTFNLPDLRGEFVRGWDDGRGVDTGRGLGSFQAESFKSHTHQIAVSSTGSAAGGALQPVGDWETDVQTANNVEPVGGTETRPRNVALMYVIKY